MGDPDYGASACPSSAAFQSFRPFRLAPPPNYPPLNYGKYTEVVQIYDTALFIDPKNV
jgi:hypothetical protein